LHGFTIKLKLDDELHPLASTPFTLYVVVTFGEAITLDPLVDESPVDGDHE
jgi:hypothetical protein